MGAQFQSADAFHAVANYNGLTPGPTADLQVAPAGKTQQVEDSEHQLLDPHSDPQSAAPDLVLLIQE